VIVPILTPPITEFGFRACAETANGLSTSDAVGTAMSASFPNSRLVYSMRE
jgi:hypothetical protein